MDATRRQELRMLAGCVALFALGVALGWAGHRPASRVEYRDKLRTVTIRETVEATRDATRTETRETRHRATRRVAVSRPDGTRTVTTETVEGADLLAMGAHVASRVAVSVAGDAASRETARVDVPSVAPSWRVAGLVGVGVAGWRPVYGGAVSRRVLGPVWAGAWGLSSGEAGVSLAVEW